MELKTPYKTLMFYGNVLRINRMANWIAADKNGRLNAFIERPDLCSTSWNTSIGNRVWNLDARVEFGRNDNWEETLTYSPRDQQWMITAVGKLDVAHFLYGDDTAHKAMSRTIDVIADLIRRKTADWDLRDTFKALMTHATPPYLQASPVTEMLRDKLFPKPKEPEYRVVKDYYGADVIVPGWAEWIAINRKGSVMAFDMRPGISPGHFWEYGIQDKQGQVTQVAWRDGTTSKENWRDSLREVQP